MALAAGAAWACSSTGAGPALATAEVAAAAEAVTSDVVTARSPARVAIDPTKLSDASIGVVGEIEFLALGKEEAFGLSFGLQSCTAQPIGDSGQHVQLGAMLLYPEPRVGEIRKVAFPVVGPAEKLVRNLPPKSCISVEMVPASPAGNLAQSALKVISLKITNI